MKFIFFIINLLSIFVISEQCKNVNTQNNFNVTEYLNGKWYIQMQQVTNYLPIEDNYCVTAEYNLSNKKVPFYNGKVISVYNYANKDMVNGENVNKNKNILCARIPNNNIKSKLLVAPCFLPNLFAGDYWVIAAGPNSTKYEWAIVSGGQPNIQYLDGGTSISRTARPFPTWLIFKPAMFFTSYLLIKYWLYNKQIIQVFGFLLEIKLLQII